MRQQQDKAPWIVKSGGRILGPYSYSEVVNKLESREIMILDEVARPFRRWNYIRDEAAFAQVVEEIRLRTLAENDGGPDTGTVSASSFTMSVTEPIQFVRDDLTDEVPVLRDENVKDAEFESIENQPHNTRGGGQHSYAYAGDVNVQRQAQESTRLLWILTGATIFAVIVIVAHNFVKGRKLDLFHLKNEAVAALQVGNYPKALESLKRAYAEDEESRKIFPILAVLQMQLENQTAEPKRLLLKAWDQNISPKRTLNALGIAGLITGDLEVAEGYFTNSSTIDPDYSEVLVNLGTTALEKKNYELAQRFFEKAIAKGSRDGGTYLLLAEALIHRATSEGRTSGFNQAKNILAQYIENNFDYVQEAAFYIVYIEHLQGSQPTKNTKVLTTLLDMDPEQTNLHRHNLFIYRGPVSWDKLSQKCLEMVGEQNKSPYEAALNALCLSKAKQGAKAIVLIEDAIQQSPRDALLQSLYSYLLKVEGRSVEAASALTRSIEFDSEKQFRLPIILSARECGFKQDLKCSQEKWQELYDQNPRDISSAAGLANYHFAKENFVEAEKYAASGFKLSQSYIPLLEYKQKAISKGLIPADPVIEL